MVAAVEINAYCQRVLRARQADGSLERFPIHDDVYHFDGKPLQGEVDIITAGFPCQDISKANPKGAGINGNKSGAWSEVARIVGEVLPRYVFLENTPALLCRGFDRVLGDLAELGYNAQWCVLGASDVGAPHRRRRLWVLATHSHSVGLERKLQARTKARTVDRPSHGSDSDRWKTEPGVCRVVDGMAHRVDRLRAIGNGMVPQCAAAAFHYLLNRDKENNGFSQLS
tara:strand:- start:2879 stop:3559 length:681 start_codon:yes stop_codon:yes gene_type:complete